MSYNEFGLPANIQRYGLSDIVNGTSSSSSNIEVPNTTKYVYDKVDDLTLKYLNGKLNSVDDSSDADCTLSIGTDFNEKTQCDDEYSYDACGRLIKDRNKGISISYNVLGLPSEIKDFTGSIRYTYSADGTLLMTEYGTHAKEAIIIRPGQILLSEVFHLQEASIKVGEVEYTDSIISRVWNEAGWTDSSGRYVAAIRDRHGSLRATYTRPFQTTGNTIGGIGVSRPLTQGKTYGNLTAYYPGGLPFADWQAGDKYLFCGKELERYMGLLTYDFHARICDPQLGLFLTTDPYAGSYPDQSPYIYCAGNPISLTDPTGCKISTDLIGNTDREKFETFVQFCSYSTWFSTLYDLIDSHPTQLQLVNGRYKSSGETQDGLDPKRNLIYLDFDSWIYDSNNNIIQMDLRGAFEELYHAYQHLYSDIDDHTRNAEFEAKAASLIILGELESEYENTPAHGTLGEVSSFNKMNGEYDKLSVNYVKSLSFINAYINGGREYVNYIIGLSKTIPNYKIGYGYDWPVNFVPYTFINYIKAIMNNTKFNIKSLFLIGLLLSFLTIPLAVTSQKLNIVNIKLGLWYRIATEGLIGPDTIVIMNNTMFHKIMLNHYGKDKYYDILTYLKKNNAGLRVIVSIYDGHIENKLVLRPQIHNDLCKITGDSTFAGSLTNLITQNYIFNYYYMPQRQYPIDSVAKIHGRFVYDLSWPPELSYYFNNEFDTLSKDEFLERQIHRIDSILTKTHLYYSRYDSDRIYDTDEYPLFTDSVTCMPPEYPSNLFHN